MKDFSGKFAVVTGGGTGMGRELVRQLVTEGCSVAMCDVNPDTMEQTRKLALADAPQGVRVSCTEADVSVEQHLLDFAAATARELETDRIHLLFNNAGIGGGGSFVAGPRSDWERTFNICWGGVYFGCRAFLPMLLKADEAHIVNTSSVNGFFASIGPGRPHTAYSAAKFAVKGFTEALMEDLKVNAPHIKCSIVMPGHIGTEIVGNSMKIIGPDQAFLRGQLAARGIDPEALSGDQLVEVMNAGFRDNAPTSASAAAKIILDGVKAERWRILVGEDAVALDASVRATPEEAYTQAFQDKLNIVRTIGQQA